jgi:hypothetical protein
MRKQNPSLLNRIPLAALIGVWLVLVVLGAVLVFSVFFSQPDSPATATPVVLTDTPATGRDNQPVATQPPSAPAAQPTQAPAEPAQSAPVVTPTIPALQEPGMGFGIQADYITSPSVDFTQQAKRLRMGWIKQQMRWGVFSPAQGQFDWTGFDRAINQAADKGLKVMLSIVTAPQWSHPNLQPTGDDPGAINAPPDDLNAFATFVGEVVDRYPGKVHAIEIWNEQNIDAEWRAVPQAVSPEKYVEMLKLASQVIKQKDPNIIVISGALAPTGFFQGGCSAAGCDDGPYLKKMVELGALNYVDCVGVHANGYNVPPDKNTTDGYNDPSATFRGPFDNPIPSWYFRSTLELYRDTVQNQKPLCVTEFGWATTEGFGVTVPGYEFANDNTLQEQADWIVQAFQLVEEWKYIKLAFLFNLNYAQMSPDKANDRTAAWSIMDVDGNGRPAFEALRLYMKDRAQKLGLP